MLLHITIAIIILLKTTTIMVNYEYYISTVIAAVFGIVTARPSRPAEAARGWAAHLHRRLLRPCPPEQLSFAPLV